MTKKGGIKRIIEVKEQFRFKSEKAWRIIEDVRSYPKYIVFMRTASIEGEFTKGNKWNDISTIMFLPLKVVHEIIEVERGQEAVFLIRLPFGGSVVQKIDLNPDKNGIQLRIITSIDWRWKLLDILFGRVLENRTRKMLEESFKEIEKIF